RVVSADDERYWSRCLTEHGNGRAGKKNEGDGPHHTTDVRGSEVTAQCHAPALPRRERITAERGNSASGARDLKYASESNPARGPAGARDSATLLTGSSSAAILTGCERQSVGTMAELGGRYAPYTTRLIDSVLAAPGHTPAELRRAVLARAARLSGTTSRPSFPLSTRSSPPDPLSTSWRGGTQE